MGFIIKIISSILLVIVILISIYAISRSSIILGRIWQEGIDLKATIQKLRESFTGKVNLIVLKDKMAIYKDGQIVGFNRYEPSTVDDGVLSSEIFAQGEAHNLKKLMNGDMFEFRNNKYKIIYISGCTSGNINGRHFDLVRQIKAEKQ